MTDDSRRARFKDAVSAKVRGDDLRQAEQWQPEPVEEKPSDLDWSLYAGLLLLSGLVGIAIFFACGNWDETWVNRPLADIALTGPEPLAAQYPWLSAVVAMLLTFVLLRVLVFMHRLESR